MDNKNKKFCTVTFSIINETNGISLIATVDMMLNCHRLKKIPQYYNRFSI